MLVYRIYIFSLYQLANRWPPRPPPLLFSRAGFGGACVASFVGRVVCLLWFRPYPLGGLHMLAFLIIVGESEDILGVSGFQVCSSARLRCPGALRALCSECGSGSLSSPPRRGVGLASCVASLGGWRGAGGGCCLRLSRRACGGGSGARLRPGPGPLPGRSCLRAPRFVARAPHVGRSGVLSPP